MDNAALHQDHAFDKLVDEQYPEDYWQSENVHNIEMKTLV